MAIEYTVTDLQEGPRALARFTLSPDGTLVAHYFDVDFRAAAERGLPLHGGLVTPADGAAFIQALERRYARSSTTVLSVARPL